MSEAALSGLALLWVDEAATAHAFTEPRTYFASPSVGGGGGRWFTGSPAEGYACSVCHEPMGSESVGIGGLPESGYTPGKSYEITLAWPDFAERSRALREAGEEPASMSLVAELVADSGQGAGTLEIAPPDEAASIDLCAFPEGAPAANLYRLPPGEQPHEAGTQCTSDALGERCVVAVLSCGAERLQFTWTAPEEDQGTVWFAAGFVATEKPSGDPSGDAVTEILVPMASPKSGSEVHETVLQSDCSVAQPGRARGSSASWAGMAGMALLVALRRRRGARR